jgi:hypothetical protein
MMSSMLDAQLRIGEVANAAQVPVLSECLRQWRSSDPWVEVKERTKGTEGVTRVKSWCKMCQVRGSRGVVRVQAGVK